MIRIDSHTPAIVGQVLLAASVIVHGVLNFVAEHRSTGRLLAHRNERKEQVTGDDQSPG